MFIPRLEARPRLRGAAFEDVLHPIELRVLGEKAPRVEGLPSGGAPAGAEAHGLGHLRVQHLRIQGAGGTVRNTRPGTDGLTLYFVMGTQAPPADPLLLQVDVIVIRLEALREGQIDPALVLGQQ